jgi:hypothetical protein
MAFKTGGFKTKYIEEYGYMRNEYTIYCAVESVSDVCIYKMLDDKGNEQEINISAEDDTDDYGNHSLIDCLFYLKQHKDKYYQHKEYDIIIEEMNNEEMKTIYGR